MTDRNSSELEDCWQRQPREPECQSLPPRIRFSDEWGRALTLTQTSAQLSELAAMGAQRLRGQVSLNASRLSSRVAALELSRETRLLQHAPSAFRAPASGASSRAVRRPRHRQARSCPSSVHSPAGEGTRSTEQSASETRGRTWRTQLARTPTYIQATMTANHEPPPQDKRARQRNRRSGPPTHPQCVRTPHHGSHRARCVLGSMESYSRLCEQLRLFALCCLWQRFFLFPFFSVVAAPVCCCITPLRYEGQTHERR